MDQLIQWLFSKTTHINRGVGVLSGTNHILCYYGMKSVPFVFDNSIQIISGTATKKFRQSLRCVKTGRVDGLLI